MSKESSPEKKESDEEDVNLFSRIKEKARLNSRPSISIVEVEELLSGVKEDELEEDEGSEEEGFEEEDSEEVSLDRGGRLVRDDKGNSNGLLS